MIFELWPVKCVLMNTEVSVSPMSSDDSESDVSEPRRKSRRDDEDQATPTEGTPNALITYSGPPVFIQLLDEPKSFRALPSKRNKKIVSILTAQFGHLNKVTIARRGDLKINPSTPIQKQSLLDLTSVDDLNVKCIPIRSERDFRAVIYGVPLDLEEADIITELSNCNVLEAKRLSRWNENINAQELTKTVALKFASGRFPDHVMIAFQSFPVRQYIPPPTHCKKCWDWSHWQDECRMPTKCRRCGDNHQGEEGPCKNPLKCVNCAKDHLTGTRQCPEFARRQDTMRTATAQGIGYEVAARMRPTTVTAPSPVPQAAPYDHNLEKEFITLKKRMDDYEKNGAASIEKHPIIASIRSSLSSQASKITALEGELSDVKEKYASVAEATNVIRTDIQSLAEESKRRHEELIKMIAPGGASQSVSPPKTRSNSKSSQSSSTPVPVDNDKNKKKGTNQIEKNSTRIAANAGCGYRRGWQVKGWPPPRPNTGPQSNQHKEPTPANPPPIRPPNTARKKDPPTSPLDA